jgi:hypothetical protein
VQVEREVQKQQLDSIFVIIVWTIEVENRMPKELSQFTSMLDSPFPFRVAGNLF